MQHKYDKNSLSIRGVNLIQRCASYEVKKNAIKHSIFMHERKKRIYNININKTHLA